MLLLVARGKSEIFVNVLKVRNCKSAEEEEKQKKVIGLLREKKAKEIYLGEGKRREKGGKKFLIKFSREREGRTRKGISNLRKAV